VTDRRPDLAAWLASEIAAVEAKLAANPPMCALDREGAAPPGLKELEGRYALLRRARRLLEDGGELSSLDHEVEKAERIAHASRGASPQWIGYARGLAEAFGDVRRRVEGPTGAFPRTDPT
jgi:hypothetical protein